MERPARILIVDDDVHCAESILDVLTEIGYVCEMVHNGQDALDKLKVSSYDLLLTDIKMPVLNGVQLTAYLRQDNKDIPILVMTAFRYEPLKQQASRLDIQGVIYKPMDMDELIGMIEKNLAER